MQTGVQCTPPERSSAGVTPGLWTLRCTELPGGAATHADAVQSQIRRQVDGIMFPLTQSSEEA